jgi:hypothetical protein
LCRKGTACLKLNIFVQKYFNNIGWLMSRVFCLKDKSFLHLHLINQYFSLNLNGCVNFIKSFCTIYLISQSLLLRMALLFTMATGINFKTFIIVSPLTIFKILSDIFKLRQLVHCRALDDLLMFVVSIFTTHNLFCKMACHIRYLLLPTALLFFKIKVV